MTRVNCTGREDANGHVGVCVGEQGHAGPHWCLLGHVWTDTEYVAEEEAS